MNKQCKQCMKMLPDTEDFFRPYVPRGKGLRKTTVGRNTVCRDCEQINNIATRIFKQGPKTNQEQELLDRLPAYYKQLVAIGGQPIGAYARHILQEVAEPQARGSAALGSILDKINTTIDAGDPFLLEYDSLLSMELVKEPDVYQEMLESLRERTAGPDGRVKPEYKDKFEAVATRFDEYEDNYEWDK